MAVAKLDSLEFQYFYGDDLDQESNYLWSKCTKNPGHVGFIPISEFGVEHLPQQYQDEIYVEYIKDFADLTVRLRIRHSPHRPRNPHRPQGSSTGTASVLGVSYIDDKDCICQTCQSEEPKRQNWWEIHLVSANHCVYDSVEAKNVKVDFFYEGDDRVKKEMVETLCGVRVKDVVFNCDICSLMCATHNDELGSFLESMCEKNRENLNKIVEHQSKIASTPQENCLVIIGHPHGQPKCVTVGVLKDSYPVVTFRQNFDRTLGSESINIDYTTKSCPGNSGGPVLGLDVANSSFFGNIACTHLRKNDAKNLNTGCTQLNTDDNYSAMHDALNQMRHDIQLVQDNVLAIMKLIAASKPSDVKNDSSEDDDVDKPTSSKRVKTVGPDFDAVVDVSTFDKPPSCQGAGDVNASSLDTFVDEAFEKMLPILSACLGFGKSDELTTFLNSLSVQDYARLYRTIISPNQCDDLDGEEESEAFAPLRDILESLFNPTPAENSLSSCCGGTFPFSKFIEVMKACALTLKKFIEAFVKQYCEIVLDVEWTKFNVFQHLIRSMEDWIDEFNRCLSGDGGSLDDGGVRMSDLSYVKVILAVCQMVLMVLELSNLLPLANVHPTDLESEDSNEGEEDAVGGSYSERQKDEGDDGYNRGEQGDDDRGGFSGDKKPDENTV